MDDELARRLDRLTVVLALVGAALVAILASLVDTGTIQGFVVAATVAAAAGIAIFAIVAD